MAVMAASCSAGRVTISPADLARLAESPEIPVVYRASPEPWVDCPTNEGERLWTLPMSASEAPAPAGGPWATAALSGGGPSLAGAPLLPVSGATGGNVWEQFQAGYTEGLRTPPIDPARATAYALAAAGGAASPPLRLAPPEAAGQAAPRRGTNPVLLVETTRFVLVGCWYVYRPWFDVRATLVDGASGRVLWRDACLEPYPVPPVDDRPPASPALLAANGGAVYAEFIQDRATQCAGALVERLGRRGR